LKEKTFSRLCGIGCLLLMFLFFGMIIFYDSFTVQFMMSAFVIGFVTGILWVCAVLFDPKSKYYVRKKEASE